MGITETLTTLLRDGFILVFNQDKLDIVRTAEALRTAGLNNMEVTCRIRQPLEKIGRLRAALPELVVGSASLIDAPAMVAVYNAAHPCDPLPTPQQAADAGACYLVSAGNFQAETYQRLGDTCVLMPGCGTVSEILREFALGANLVKVFPADQLGGPRFIKAVDAPLHKMISLVPTGGTNAANIGEYIAAGVLVVGGSFSAVPAEVLARVVESQDYGLLAAELKKIKELIDATRAAQYGELDFATATVAEISDVTGRRFNLR